GGPTRATGERGRSRQPFAGRSSSGHRALTFPGDRGRAVGVTPALPRGDTAPDRAKGRAMREVFQQELHEVQERLVEIATLVADSIDDATRAFNESDVTLAEGVIENDRRIDVLAAELDELAITILAR